MFNKFHGKVLKYSEDFSNERRSAFMNSLPRRSDFINSNDREPIIAQLKAGDPILFLPNDIIEQHVKIGGTSIVYKPIMIGVLRDGTKAAIVLNGVDLSFLLRIPEDADTWSFTTAIKEALKSRNVYMRESEVVQKLPGKLFHEKPVDYMKLSFNTLFQYKKAIKEVRFDKDADTLVIEYNIKKRFGTGTNYLNKPTGPKSETAEDDLTCYYRKIARQNKFKLAGWNQIKNYTIIRDDTYVKRYCVPVCLEINVKDITDIANLGIDPIANPLYKDLIQDKTLMAGWDLETYAKHSTGNVPDPFKVFDSMGNEEDIVFLESIPFSWWWAPAPMLTVAISLLPCPPVEDCLIIQCSTQVELIKVKALVLERMSPDVLCGFNDGMYDWPFILERAKAYDEQSKLGLVQFLKEHMSVIPWDENNAKFMIRGESKEHIKLEAGINYEPTTFLVPGTIVMDIRGIFMQLYPKADKSSLNYYLQQNKLASKEDMPYQTMFKIVRLVMFSLMQITESDDYDTNLNYLKQLRTDRGVKFVPFGPGGIRDDTPAVVKLLKAKAPTYAYGVDRMTTDELIKLMGGVDEGGATNEGVKKVIVYCNVDARKCLELLRVRNIIPDKREVANLSFTSFYDSVYRAGGVKVRNLVLTHAAEPCWNLAFSNISTGIKDDRKYPGAYVVSPKKGLYRDHRITKRHRRAAPSSNNSLNFKPTTITDVLDPELIDPKSPKFDTSLLDDIKHTVIKQAAGDIYKKLANDESDETDRPCTGLDFSSLYPSLIMTYNLSPEKVVLSFVEMQRLTKAGYEFIPVNFKYGIKDQPDSLKEDIQAWIVQHKHPARQIISEETARAKQEGVAWHKLIRPETIAKVKKMYRETTLAQWREYGMGIYPYILKDLFDKRSRVKKLMEHFTEPKEFMDKVFNESMKLDLFKPLCIAEQKIRFVEFLDREIEKRLAEFERSKKGFHSWKHEVIVATKKFFVDKWVQPDGEYSQLTIEDLFNEMTFKITYYNTSQLALKVFMNTFYGETGNQLSSFFIVAVAGGITTMGQYNTKMVKAFVESEGFNVLYGDTDSLYVCCPESKFAEIDDLFTSGKISKLEYWERMTEITMETMDEFKVEVNNILMFDNKGPFLMMAYEEALFPYVLAGKKKYIGIQHQGIVNFAACMPDCTLEEFMNTRSKGRSVFIRGLQIVTRGASEFLKQICYDVFRQAFCITETRTLKEIVEHKLHEITKTKWDPNTFAKSAKYKLPGVDAQTGAQKQGNVAVLRFMARMNRVNADHPQLGIKPPEIGERFKYCIVKRYPWTYDVRGCQKAISVADQYEFLDSLTNSAYKEIVGELEVDMDYYVTHEIIGQFARFIIYHPDYDQYFRDDMDDADYKTADEKAWAYAKKTLTHYFEQNFGTKYAKKGKVHKEIFKAVNGKILSRLHDEYGVAGTMFSISNQIETKNIESELEDFAIQSDVANKFVVDAKKHGESMADPFEVEQLLRDTKSDLLTPKWYRKTKPDPFELNRLLITGRGSYYRTKRDFLQKLERELLDVAKRQIPDFQTVYKSSLDAMVVLVEKIVEINNIESIATQPLESDADATEVSMNLTYESLETADVHISQTHGIVFELYDTYNELISVYRQLKELEMLRDRITDLRTATVDKTAMPTSLKKKSLKDDFQDFIMKQNASFGNDGW